MFRPAALIPAYQCEETVGEVIAGLRRYVPSVLVVDDGSTDDTSAVAEAAGAQVLRRAANGGKGAAIRDGLVELLSGGHSHVLFADGDGQHDPEDASRLLAEARAGAPFVIGSRMGAREPMPGYRYWANYLGSRVLSRMTGRQVEDGQSGYRVIAADLLRRLRLCSRGYLIDTEVLIKAAPFVPEFAHVRVRVIYGGKSHYRPFRDTWIISCGAIYYKVFETE